MSYLWPWCHNVRELFPLISCYFMAPSFHLCSVLLLNTLLLLWNTVNFTSQHLLHLINYLKQQASGPTFKANCKVLAEATAKSHYVSSISTVFYWAVWTLSSPIHLLCSIKQTQKCKNLKYPMFPFLKFLFRWVSKTWIGQFDNCTYCITLWITMWPKQLSTSTCLHNRAQ